MATITKTGTNSLKRFENSISKVVNAADGYRVYYDSTTPVTIANIVTAVGVITLPNTYTVGRFNLQVVVNGIIRPNVGVSLAANDYVELNNRQIQLGTAIVAGLALAPLTSNIEIRWNRFWPGVRDALFENLHDITTNISEATRDTGNLRSAPATSLNPLVTLSDLFRPNLPNRFLMTDSRTTAANYSFNIDFSALANPITPPAGFRYALCQISMDADDNGTPNGGATAYMGAYTATPASLAVANQFVTQVNLNNATEVNVQNSGSIVIELNSPANPTADLTVYVLMNTSNFVISLSVFLEGWIR